MTLISEYLAADLSADVSADALCIINIGKPYIFISYLGSLKLILLFAIIVMLGRVELWL